MRDAVMPVDARGALRIDAPTGRSLGLVADGDTLRLELPGWPEARALLSGSFGSRRHAARRLGVALGRYGLALSVESAGKPVFQLGHGVSPNWLARLLGYTRARIPMSAVGLLFRR